MKRQIGILLCLALVFIAALSLADVTIDAAHFPDAVFREYLAQFDGNQDGSFSEEELVSVTRIEVYNRGIKSVEGVRLFKNLTYLDCDRNQLTALDVSGLSALTDLSCHTNQLTDLDVSMCSALESLGCAGNRLTRLNVRGCRSLSKLECYTNQLAELSLEGCDDGPPGRKP